MHVSLLNMRLHICYWCKDKLITENNRIQCLCHRLRHLAAHINFQPHVCSHKNDPKDFHTLILHFAQKNQEVLSDLNWVLVAVETEAEILCIFTCICDCLCMQSNLILSYYSLLLSLDPAHMGRAEKGELKLAGQEPGFICHRYSCYCDRH